MPAAVTVNAAIAPRANALFDASSNLERRSVDTVVEERDGHTEEADAPHGDAIKGDALLNRVLRDRSRSAKLLQGPVDGRRIAGQMTTTYEGPTPREVRSAIDAAVQQWNSVLALSPGAPVEISVLWTDLGSRLLGQAGTEGEYRDAAQFPTNRWYPAALANQLANLDVNGAGTPEILVELNSGLGQDWYIGSEGTPGAGQIDLYSVVLHEIAHGLGFLGSASAGRTGETSVDYDPPSIYDDFIQSASGKRLIDLPLQDALAALTSGSLTFDIGAGRTVPISAPERFLNGSSYSHFDESVDRAAPGALMTPSLMNGEVQRGLDAAVIGVLDQVGWNLATPLLVPSVDEFVVSSETVEVTWTEDWSLPVTLPTAYSVETDPSASSGPLPGRVVLKSPASLPFSAVLERLQNGTTYTLALKGLRAGFSSSATSPTTALLPANPNRVTALETTQGAPFQLSWEAPVSSGKTVTGFDIQYRRGSEIQWSDVGPTASHSTSMSLAAGRYWFRVRAGNAAGPGAWSHTGVRGVSASQVRYLPVDGQVARLYRAYLDRPPDTAGMDYWVSLRSEGADMLGLSAAFGSSAEFVGAYGNLSDEAFVATAYRNVLQREADAAGYDYWLGFLADGVSRARIMLEFSESAEFIATTATAAPQSGVDGRIERVYMASLRRLPSINELELARNQSSRQLAAYLLERGEFSQEHGLLTNRQFLDVLFENVTGDPGDEAAVGILLVRLNDGATRSALLVDLADTPAFSKVTGTAR